MERSTTQHDSELGIPSGRPVTKAVCEALQKVGILQVGEVPHGCHQGRPKHLLRPRAGAVHAAEHHDHRFKRILVIDRLQLARKHEPQGICQELW